MRPLRACVVLVLPFALASDDLTGAAGKALSDAAGKAASTAGGAISKAASDAGAAISKAAADAKHRAEKALVGDQPPSPPPPRRHHRVGPRLPAVGVPVAAHAPQHAGGAPR